MGVNTSDTCCNHGWKDVPARFNGAKVIECRSNMKLGLVMSVCSIVIAVALDQPGWKILSDKGLGFLVT